jgi:hypothetical protein
VRRRLAGDKCWAAAYLSKGENNGEEEEALGVRAFYSWWRERERVCVWRRAYASVTASQWQLIWWEPGSVKQSLAPGRYPAVCGRF